MTYIIASDFIGADGKRYTITNALIDGKAYGIFRFTDGKVSGSSIVPERVEYMAFLGESFKLLENSIPQTFVSVPLNF